MADPLSIIGGVASILQISSLVVSLVKAAKGAPNDRQQLLIEINATTALCQTLRDYAEINAESWIETLRALNQNDSPPLDHFRRSLEYLHKKLALESKTDNTLQVWAQNLKWPFTKSELLELVTSIERQKSLLSIALTNDNLRLSMAIRDETQRITRKLDTVKSTQEEQYNDMHLIATSVDSLHVHQQTEAQKTQYREDQERKQILLAKLTTIDFEATHADISSRRAQNTGRWLLDCPQYYSWRSKISSSVIWCPGIPGAGKTVLASLIIDSLREPEVARNLPESLHACNGVAGIYCSYKSPQTTENLLGSLLQQLLLPLKSISYSDATAMITGNVATSLSEALKRYQNTFIIVDALDECPNRGELLKALRQLLESSHNSTGGAVLHILVTGRDNVAAETKRELKPDEHLEIRSSETDVRNYLKQGLCVQPQLYEWIKDSPEFGSLVVEAITSRVNGMFLLARLYTDLLASIPTKRGVRRALERLPRGIDDTYTEAWGRVSAQSHEQSELGKKVLSWIIHSSRPLRVSEIQEALAIEKGDEFLDAEGLLDAAQLTSFCAGLVIMNEQRQLMSLIHPTTQEYFNTRKESLFPAAHEDIAATCITYLRMRSFRDQGPLQDFEAFDRRRHSYPLLGYAAVNWGWHVRQARSMRTTNLALTLLHDESARLAACQALFLNNIGVREVGTEWPEKEEWQIGNVECSVATLGSLHVAAYFGLIDVAEILLQGSAKVDDMDSFGGTPVHWALLDRQDEMLEYLLIKGGDPNSRRGHMRLRRWPMLDGRTLPLTIAAYTGNKAAIESLLQHGANIDKEDENISHSTAVSVALYTRNHEVAKVLLTRGANVNKNPSGILDAATHGSLDTLQILIEGGASAENLQKALGGAASACLWDKVKLLLEHGADPNGFSYKSSLGSDLPHQSLLRSGKTLTAELGENWVMANPLVKAIEAFWSYHENFDQYKCLEILLDAGADVNRLSARDYFYADDFITLGKGGWSVPSGRYTTPLFTAAYFRRLDIVSELVRRGADVNFILGEHTTALSSALDSESYQSKNAAGDLSACTTSTQTRAVIQLLIELGADPNLCTPTAKQRVEELLAMSPQEQDNMSALQTLVFQPQYGEDWTRRSFRERRAELTTLIAAGAEPELCCARDRRRIQEFLGWSEQEIDTLDRDREARLAMRDRYSKAIL